MVTFIRNMSSKIKSITSKEILSAGAFPSIETTVELENGLSGKASVPFGSSAGVHEAAVIQDGDDNRYFGKGMLTAIKNVEKIIAPDLIGLDVHDQVHIDKKLTELDPTEQKSKLGGNSILSVSLASIRASARANNNQLYSQIIQSYELDYDISTLPKPMMVLIEGGAHADNSTDFQEYLICVDMDGLTKDRVRAGIELYHTLADVLKKDSLNTNVGLEGAYAPSGIGSNEKPLDYLTRAIEVSQYNPGTDITLAMDVAASEFYSDGKYDMSIEAKTLSAEELINYYRNLISKYPVSSIEDPYDQDDWDAWKLFKQTFGDEVMVVGDDLTVSQEDRLKKAAEMDTINSMIIKPNQAGTLTEIMDTIRYAREKEYKIIVSHRGGGETTDTFIADLGAAVGAEYIKTGPSRGERVVKYNRLMEIGDELGL